MTTTHATDPAEFPIARRWDAIPETVFATFSRLAIEHDAINLGQGFPNYDGPETVKAAAIEAINGSHNQYARTQGVPQLNRAIAGAWERRTGMAVDPDAHITVTSGCTEAIPATLLGLINPGEEVIVFEPYYDSYPASLAMCGAVPRYVTLRPPHFALPVDEFKAAFTDRTRAVLLNTPHNPTGKVFAREEMDVIAAQCQQRDALVISDEVYEYLVFDVPHIPMATLPGMWERTVTLSSLGKTFSLTGWKIGWAIAPDHLTRGVRSAHQYLTYATATPLQHGAAAALSLGDAYFKQFVADYRARRDVLIAGLEDVGFDVFTPQGTYFVLADHTRFGFRDDVAFCRHLVEHVGVAAIPPSFFYHDPADGANLVRFAFCKDIPTLEAAISRMKQHLKAGAAR